jgi:hypothetical protein
MNVKETMHNYRWTVYYALGLATLLVVMYGISLWRHW